MEDYAGARIRGAKAADLCVAKWAQGDVGKVTQFYEVAADHPDLTLLEEELLDEFGLEHFIGKIKPKDYHIRHLEIAILNCYDLDTKAKLYKELREYQGWTSKPAEKGVSATVTIGATPTAMLDPNNPRETERIVMSIFAGLA